MLQTAFESNFLLFGQAKNANEPRSIAQENFESTPLSMRLPTNFTILILLLFISIGMQSQSNTAPINSNARIDTSQVPIQIDTKALQRLDLTLPDGGLSPQPGVLNLQIFRATRDDAMNADGDGWTYSHHMDLAVWKGKMYAAWNMTLIDEDRPPAKVVYSTSSDGVSWSRPTDLFPRQFAWACRFYFYQSTNHRMLAFCAANNSQGAISEDKKSILLVREVKPDHSLGEVFTLINPVPGIYPSFEASSDNGFVEACREAVAKNILLEQQDYGVFLGDRKMEWHDKAAPYNGFYKFGKALCFFHRVDGTLVGLSKMGFVTLSEDEGKTWSKPKLPESLTAGAAKVWGQKSNDNRFALVYNPDPKKGKRFPLVVVSGEDGIHFDGMRVVHGEYSPLRYAGLYKDLGYQYVRGLAEWSNDATLADKDAIWLIYSVNKEDIWVSRIPLPVVPEPVNYPNDDFDRVPLGSIVKDWNLYAPKWAPVTVVPEPGKPRNRCLELRDGDPVDHAQATRLFPTTQSAVILFRLRPMQRTGYFETELTDTLGHPLMKMSLTAQGAILVSNSTQEVPVGTYREGQWLSLKLRVDAAAKKAILYLNGKKVGEELTLNAEGNYLARLTFRTGKRYGLNDKIAVVPGSDQQSRQPELFLVDQVVVRSLKK